MAKSKLIRRKKPQQKVAMVECPLVLQLPQDQAQEIIGDIQTILNNVSYADIRMLSKLVQDPIGKPVALGELRKRYG